MAFIMFKARSSDSLQTRTSTQFSSHPGAIFLVRRGWHAGEFPGPSDWWSSFSYDADNHSPSRDLKDSFVLGVTWFWYESRAFLRPLRRRLLQASHYREVLCLRQGIFFARYPRPGTGVFNFRQIFSSITDEIPYDEIPYLVMARNRDQVAIRSAKIRGANGEQMGSKYARLRDNHPMRALAPISKLLGSLKPVNRGRLSKPTKLWSPSVFCSRTRLVQITAALPIHSATATRRENARTGGHIRWLPCRCAPSCTVFEVLVEVFGLFLVFQALLAEFARVRAHKQFAGSPGDSHNL